MRRCLALTSLSEKDAMTFVSKSLTECTRCNSQSIPSDSLDTKNTWKSYWNDVGKRNARPSMFADTPRGSPRLVKSTVEWRFHHGTGGRIGMYDATRYIADFEYADGTPAPVSSARHALQHFHDRQLFDLIHAASIVEGLAEANRLPRIPGVKEQRDWDPEIPLFLSDDDEHGAAPALNFAGNATSDQLNTYEAYDADSTSRRVNEKYTSEAERMNGKTIIKNPSQEGDTLTPITMFASYSPADMFREPLLASPKNQTPFDRRRWNLSSQFLVSKGPKPRNTIADGGAKIT